MLVEVLSVLPVREEKQAIAEVSQFGRRQVVAELVVVLQKGDNVGEVS